MSEMADANNQQLMIRSQRTHVQTQLNTYDHALKNSP